jgi:hypothetical protein
MSDAFDSELRLCLGEILGESPPEPDGEPLLFFRQWLGGRNLGLVPIAHAAAFSWPGRWLARVRAEDGDHAAVMFGSPSGALFDPVGAVARGGTIEEGWMLAPLDPALGVVEPYGASVRAGAIAGIFVALPPRGRSSQSSGPSQSLARASRATAMHRAPGPSAAPAAATS